MARVDVIIPAYDPGPFLDEALRSVIAQSFADWRCYVIDDGSSEDLSWVRNVDPRVRLTRQSRSGLSAARNRGIAEGNSPFVAFLDADDLWRPDKLGAQVSAIGDAKHVLCSTGFDYVNASGSWIGEGLRGFTGCYAEHLFLCAVSISTAVIGRQDLERVGGFARGLRQVQDWNLYLKLTGGGAVAIHLPAVHAYYRKHEGNMSSDYRTLRHEAIRVLEAHRAAADQRGDRELAMLARLGQRRVQRLAGVKAFDSFRNSYAVTPLKALTHLRYATRWAPTYTARAIASKSVTCLSPRRLRGHRLGLLFGDAQGD